MINITRRDFLKYASSVISAMLGVKLFKSKQVYNTFMPIVASGQAEIPVSTEPVSDGTVVDDSFVTFDDTMVFL